MTCDFHMLADGHDTSGTEGTYADMGREKKNQSMRTPLWLMIKSSDFAV